MPRVWRICKAKWSATAFTGAGAAEFPGRWNSFGQRAVYTASSRSLALLELLAHVEDKSYLRRAHYVIIPVDIPESLVHLPKRLPAGWSAVPPKRGSQIFGDRFLNSSTLPAMRVPSAIVPDEFNFLLNPLHSRFNELTIGKLERFRFDPRIL